MSRAQRHRPSPCRRYLAVAWSGGRCLAGTGSEHPAMPLFWRQRRHTLLYHIGAYMLTRLFAEVSVLRALSHRVGKAGLTSVCVFPQGSTRRTWSSRPPPATPTAGGCATAPPARCKSSEVLAAWNVTALKRLCEIWVCFFLKLTDVRGPLAKGPPPVVMLHLIFKVPILSAMLPDDQLLKHCLNFNAFFFSSVFDLRQCFRTAYRSWRTL